MGEKPTNYTNDRPGNAIKPITYYKTFHMFKKTEESTNKLN